MKRSFDDVLDHVEEHGIKNYRDSTLEDLVESLGVIGAPVEGVLEKPAQWFVGNEGFLYTSESGAQFSYPLFVKDRPVESLWLPIGEVPNERRPLPRNRWETRAEILDNKGLVTSLLEDAQMWLTLLHKVRVALEPYDQDDPLAILKFIGGADTSEMVLRVFQEETPPEVQETLCNRFVKRIQQAEDRFASPESGRILQERALGHPATGPMEYALLRNHLEHDLSSGLHRCLVRYYKVAAVLEGEQTRESVLPPNRRILLRAPQEILDHLERTKDSYERVNRLGPGPEGHVPPEVHATMLNLLEENPTGPLSVAMNAYEAAVLVNR